MSKRVSNKRVKAINPDSKLTIITRLKICLSVITYRKERCVKGLPIFIAGYEAGMKDGKSISRTDKQMKGN